METLTEADCEDPLFGSARVALELGGVSFLTLRRWRVAGRIPEPIVLAGKNYWRRSVIEALKDQGDGSTVRAPGEIGE